MIVWRCPQLDAWVDSAACWSASRIVATVRLCCGHQRRLACSMCMKSAHRYRRRATIEQVVPLHRCHISVRTLKCHIRYNWQGRARPCGEKWLHMHMHKSAEAAVGSLRSAGFVLLAAVPPTHVPSPSLSWQEKQGACSQYTCHLATAKVPWESRQHLKRCSP